MKCLILMTALVFITSCDVKTREPAATSHEEQKRENSPNQNRLNLDEVPTSTEPEKRFRP